MQTEAVTVAVQIGEFDFKFAVFKFLCDIRLKTKCSLIALPDACHIELFQVGDRCLLRPSRNIQSGVGFPLLLPLGFLPASISLNPKTSSSKSD